MVLSIDLSTRIINKHKLKSFNNPCRHSIILEGPSHILITSYGKKLALFGGILRYVG